VRVAVIGRGFGGRVVAPAFEQAGASRVVDVVSPRDQAAVAELCARPDIDLVSVHSPPFMHAEHVRWAIEAGHAVLCDKPFGRHAEDATVMHDLATGAGVVNLLNFEMRFDPSRAQVRSLIQDGVIGVPEHVHCSTFLAISRVPMRPYGWLFDASRGGGWIGAWGSHVIDFIRWALGEIVDASADVRTTIAERPDSEGKMQRCTAEDGFSAALETDTGVTVSIDSSFAAGVNRPSYLGIFGSSGALELSDDGIVRVWEGAALEKEIQLDTGGNLLAAMGRYAGVVCDAVRRGEAGKDCPTFADGLSCRKVLDRLGAGL
jgi:predicted dehydrogenase